LALLLSFLFPFANGRKAFSFFVLQLIQFISFARWRFCSFPFFPFAGGRKTVFFSCVGAYSVYISFAWGAKAFSFFVLQLIQFISFDRCRLCSFLFFSIR